MIDVTREVLSNDCRQAALSFMSGVASGWSKADLVEWLTGPYARAVRHASLRDRAAVAEVHTPAPAASVEALLVSARGQLLASLETAVLDLGTLDFIDDMVGRGLVRKTLDADGRSAWIPVDSPRLLLRDRLRSLFAADYMNIPYDYAQLFVCHRCEAVVFDERAKRRGVCTSHMLSGIVPADGDAPLSNPYVGLIGR